MSDSIKVHDRLVFSFTCSLLRRENPTEVSRVTAALQAREGPELKLNISLFHQYVWELGNVLLAAVFVGPEKRLTAIGQYSCKQANFLFISCGETYF